MMAADTMEALGIKQEEGIISEEEVAPPTPEALQKAAKTIAASYPAGDVSLYLTTLVWQDPDTWGALQEALQEAGDAARTD